MKVPNFDLTGKVVVVTGAAGGQGAAEAVAMASLGAHVVAADMVAPSLDHDDAGLIEPVALDVTDRAAWAVLAERLMRAHGRVDGLVNNAGIPMRARLGDVTDVDWDRALDVNTRGPLLGIQTLSPHMRSGASIVNVGSVSGLMGYHAVAYTVSKWALRGLSRVAALELGPRGIRVNTIHPGFIETPMTASAPAAFRAANIDQVPLGRGGTPEDVAPLVAFLISDAAAYVTGTEIPVDGGLTSHNGAKQIADQVSAAAGGEARA